MPASQPASFNLQEFTDAGQLLVGGRLYTYGYGTTAQKNAFTDPDGTVPHTYTPDGAGGQYIALNARGELAAPLYLGAGSYDISLKRADGSTVWTRKAEGVESTVNAAVSGLQLADYAALRAYKGAQQMAYVTGYLVTAAPSGIAGLFVRDDSDAISADDGGLVIVAANGVRWKRPYSGGVNIEWFDRALGDAVNIAKALATGKDVHLGKGTYTAGTLNLTTSGQTLFLHGAVLKVTQLNVNADNVTVDLGGGEIRGPLHVGKLAAQAAVGQNQLVFEDASQFVVGDQIWCSYGDNGANFPLAVPTAITAIGGNTVTLAANLTGTVPIAVGTYVGTFSWGTLIGNNASKNLRFVNGKITNAPGYFMYSWRWNQGDFATNIPNIICEKIDFSGNGLDQFLFVKARAKFIDCTFGITYDVAKTGFAYGDDADVQLVRCRMARGNFDYDFAPISDAGRSTFFTGSAGRISAIDCYFDGTNKNPTAAYFNANTLHVVWFGTGGAPHDGVAGRPSAAHFVGFTFSRCRFENYSRSAFSTTVVAETSALVADSVIFDDCQIGTAAFHLKSTVSITIRDFSFHDCRFFAGGQYAFTQAQNPKFTARFNNCALKLNGPVPQLTNCEINHSTIYESGTVSASSSATFNMVTLQSTAIKTDPQFGYAQFSGTFIIDDARFAGQSANLTDMGLMTLQDGQGAGIAVRSANGSLWYDVAAFAGKANLIARLYMSWLDGRITGLYGDDWNMGMLQTVVQGCSKQYNVMYSLPTSTSGASDAGSAAIAVTGISYPGNRPTAGDRVVIQLTNGNVHATKIAPAYADNSLVINLVDPIPASVAAGASVWFVRLVAL